MSDGCQMAVGWLSDGCQMEFPLLLVILFSMTGKGLLPLQYWTRLHGLSDRTRGEGFYEGFQEALQS